MTLLCWEGAFAMAYETWIGPVYLSGLAGETGAAVWVLSLVMASPWIGAIGQLGGLWALSRADSLKRHTLRLALAARALWLVPLFMAAFLAWRAHSEGAAFPRRNWFYLVAIVSMTCALLATASGVAWTTWVRELVPRRYRGRFFGIRQQYTTAALVIANGVAAAVVGWSVGGWRYGYGVVGCLAVMAAGASTFLLARVPDAEFGPETRKFAGRGFRELLLQPWRDREFRPVLIYNAAFTGAIQLGGNYFPFYFTRDHGIPMSRVASWVMLTQLGSFLAARFWGKRLDRLGDPLRMLWFCGHLVAISPAFYIFAGTATLQWLGPVDYFTNGMVAVGYTIAQTTLLLRAAPAGNAAIYFSVNSAASGLCAAAGVLLGGELAIWLAPWGGFRALWAITTLVRFAALWLLLRPLLPQGSFTSRRVSIGA